jgi:hypothetical protein
MPTVGESMGRLKVFERKKSFQLLLEDWERDKVVQMGGCKYVRGLLHRDWESCRSDDVNLIKSRLQEARERLGDYTKEVERLEEKLSAARQVTKIEAKWKEKWINGALEVLERYEDDEVTLREKAERQATVLGEKGIDLTPAELIAKLKPKTGEQCPQNVLK